MSLIAFNEFSKLDLSKHVLIEEDLDLFYQKSEDHVLLVSAINRININFSIREVATIKAY